MRNRARALLLLLSLLLPHGCGSSEQERENRIVTTEYERVTEMSSDLEGRRIAIEGRIAEMPWQHLVNPTDEYPQITYLDLPDGDQVVIYSKEAIRCPDRVRVRGTVVRIEGSSKRPGASEEIRYVEHQIQVDDWTCLE